MNLSKTATLCGATLFGAVALMSSSPGGAGRSATRQVTGQSLCRPAEQPLFQCRARKKTIALCAGSAGSGGRHVQYRYGRPGRVELAYPRSGKAGLSWARIGYAGGGEMQVNFNQAGHRYVLWSRMTAGAWDDEGHRAHDFSSGVSVVRGNRVVSERLCTDSDDPWIAEAPVERLLPEGQPTQWWELQEE